MRQSDSRISYYLAASSAPAFSRGGRAVLRTRASIAGTVHGILALVRYFAYGTTQKGLAHHRRFADLLGDPLGRVRTATAHAVVVPHRAACSNPGCQYVHRMAALVPGIEPLRAEGDLFDIPDAAIAVIDELETTASPDTADRMSDSASPSSRSTAPGRTPPRRTSLGNPRDGACSWSAAQEKRSRPTPATSAWAPW